MGNTVFYKEAGKEKSKIRWWDILSESFKKHSMKDLEYALAAGSVYDTASTETMLKKWHKPWVWTRVFLLFSIVGFGFFGLLKVTGINENVIWDTLIILTCITPITSMVLFWELNVARDVSFFKLLGCFFLGGLLSISFTLILGKTGIREAAMNYMNTDTDGYWSSWIAPITEEPAKLLAGLLILMALVKAGDNIFGCTGLAIGAGVGTGFTLFESFGYVISNAIVNALNYGDGSWQAFFEKGLAVVKGRSIPGINAHMLMCVPYIAMIALAYHETKSWKKSVFNKKTVSMFFASCFLHAWWDCTAGVALMVLPINDITTQAEYNMVMNAVNIQKWIITVLYLVANLFAIRLCLRQAVREGDYVSGQGMAIGERTQPHFNNGGNEGLRADAQLAADANALTVVSVGTVMPGKAWRCSNTMLIGKVNDCAIRFPADTAGLSRVHCRLTNRGSYWTVCDLGSSYGTHVNGAKLNPNTEYKLPAGSVLELGSSRVKLKIQ